jgi:2-methylcitrate dehydratase PrpD
VAVTTSSGRQERRVDHVPGDPARPFTEADVRNKFQHFVTPVGGEATARFLQSSLIALDARDSLLSLMQDLERVMAHAVA